MTAGSDLTPQLAPHMEGVARFLLGDVNRSASSKTELRFGRSGSLSVDLTKSTAYDHEAQAGGGVLWLIERETGLKGRAALDWLNEHGFPVERSEREPYRNGANGTPARSNGGSARPRERSGQAAGDGRMAPPPPTASKPKPKRQITATYDYTNAAGELLYQVVRWEWEEDGKRRKTFSQRRAMPDGAWGWGITEGRYFKTKWGDWRLCKTPEDEVGVVTADLPAIPHGLYRLPEVEDAILDGKPVYLVEGEKDADRLAKLGLAATTNSGGARHWVDKDTGFCPHAETFRGADVILPIDNDAAGRDRAGIVGRSLKGIAARLRVLDFAGNWPDGSPLWPDVPVKADVTDYIEQLPDSIDAREAIEEIVRILPDYEPPPAPLESHLGLTMWSEMGKPTDPHQWLIKNWLTAGEVSICAGPSQAGKSFLILDMAMSIARGVAFLGKYRVERGAVLYQAGEGGKGLRSKRMAAYRLAKGLRWEDKIPLAVTTRQINLHAGNEDVDRIIEDANALKAYTGLPVRLIVIDTVSAATAGADEVSGRDVVPVLVRCQRIANETGAHVMLAAHMNADATKIRGNTAWQANVDSVIFAREVPDHTDAEGRPVREFKLEKQKDGDKGFPSRFVLQVVEIGTDYEGEPITSCVIAEPSAGEMAGVDTSEPAAGRLSDNQFMYLKAVRDALKEHGQEPPADVKLPPGIRVVHKDRAAELFQARYQGNAGAERKARSDAGGKLVNRQIIGSHNPWLWLTGKPVAGAEEITSDVTGGAQDVTWADLNGGSGDL